MTPSLLHRIRLYFKSPAVIGYFIVALASVALRAPLAHFPLERDEGEYSYIAQRWLQGEIPYRASFDQKAPGVFAVYAVFERWFGTSPAAIHWGTQIFTLMTLAIFVYLGNLWMSSAASLFGAAAFILMVLDPTVLGQSSNTEIFAILPLVAALGTLYVALDRQSLIAAWSTGLLLSLACLFKQVAFVYIIGSALLMLPLQKRIGMLSSFFLGVMMVFSLVCSYFIQTGAWPQFLECVITYNREYATHLPLSECWWNLWVGLRPNLSTFWPVYSLAVYAIIPVWRSFQDRTGLRLRNYKTLLSIWLFLSFLAVSIGGYYRPHYLVLLAPPAALLAASQVENLCRRYSGHHPLRSLSVLGTILFVHCMLINSWYYFSSDQENKEYRLYQATIFSVSARIADLVAMNSAPSERVFMLGCEPEILYYAKRISASRYIYINPLMIPSPSAMNRQVETINYLKRNPPKVMVVFMRNLIGWVHDSPNDVFEETQSLLDTLPYHLVGLVPMVGDQALNVLSGQNARDMWKSSPVRLTDQRQYVAMVWKLDR